MPDKAIFLDRDNTLVEDPGYISDPDQVKLLDGVAEALVELKALGYKLIVVTNQSAVARGIITEEVLAEIHERLRQLLIEKNAFLDGIYYCPYHPEGVVAKYRKKSEYRKPNPGMLLEAADDMDIDLGQSWCIGNNLSDVEAGLRAGCKTMLIDTPSSHKESSSSMSLASATPDYKAVNIKEAVNIIKKYMRSAADDRSKTQMVAGNQNEPVRRIAEEVSAAAEPARPAEQPEPEPQTQEQPREQQTPTATTDELLDGILAQLKSMQRTEMFHEFSIMRLMAGVVQVLVLFFLLVTVWFLMSPERQDNQVFVALGFAIVLQLMALTFYTMHGRK
ncbi:MAG: D-glycero-alpha-D-manno-heptose-1,7-bisphosphate 7-phosphatase [Planctomycetota bacterium]|jgi:D,D-heptose 1,7-bisphosphate phosphatase